MGKSYSPVSASITPWLTAIRPYDFCDKTDNVQLYVRYMLNRTSEMFKYDGLPDSIPQYILEQMLQGNGNCFITETEKGLIAFTGGLGDTPDEYYRATKYIVANPALPSASKSYDIDIDGVLCRNDPMMLGLMPLCNKYATQLAENDLSIIMAQVVTRAAMVMTATTDADKLAADDFIKNLACGKFASVLGKSVIEGIAVQPGAASSATAIGQLIELQQYIKASWFNELGIDSNYNMKRESLSMVESQMNTSGLRPLVDSMFTCRKDFCEKINKMYGTNITVDYNSSWVNMDTPVTMPETATESPTEPAGEEISNEPTN